MSIFYLQKATHSHAHTRTMHSKAHPKMFGPYQPLPALHLPLLAPTGKGKTTPRFKLIEWHISGLRSALKHG
jgi:hypothetical protein